MSPSIPQKILEKLRELFPEAASELTFDSPFQLVIAVMLSAQCTDKKVNEVTPTLFAKYPNFAKLAKADPDAVAKILRPINYYQTKTKHAIAAAKLVIEEFKGELPITHDELLTLPGVGRKTANVVLSELGHEHALAVDTHVFRVAKRLGLAVGENVRTVEDELKIHFKKEEWRDLHHGLILHGRRTCKARTPECSACALEPLCPSSRLKGEEPTKVSQ